MYREVIGWVILFVDVIFRFIVVFVFYVCIIVDVIFLFWVGYKRECLYFFLGVYKVNNGMISIWKFGFLSIFMDYIFIKVKLELGGEKVKMKEYVIIIFVLMEGRCILWKVIFGMKGYLIINYEDWW